MWISTNIQSLQALMSVPFMQNTTRVLCLASRMPWSTVAIQSCLLNFANELKNSTFDIGSVEMKNVSWQAPPRPCPCLLGPPGLYQLCQPPLELCLNQSPPLDPPHLQPPLQNPTNPIFQKF